MIDAGRPFCYVSNDTVFEGKRQAAGRCTHGKTDRHLLYIHHTMQ
mgnify:CR=1 FL=1